MLINHNAEALAFFTFFRNACFENIILDLLVPSQRRASQEVTKAESMRYCVNSVIDFILEMFGFLFTCSCTFLDGRCWVLILRLSVHMTENIK